MKESCSSKGEKNLFSCETNDVFLPELKRSAVEELLSQTSTTAQTCRRHNISSGLLYHWKGQYARKEFGNEPRFGTQPNLNKLFVQYRQQVERKSFDEEILDALRDQTKKGSGGATWRVIVNPEEDLPEQKSLSLLILPPIFAWGDDEAAKESLKKQIIKLSTYCGGKNRLYRNTLLFLSATSKGIGKLRQAHRDQAALKGVQKDYGTQFSDEQKEELKKRIEGR